MASTKLLGGVIKPKPNIMKKSILLLVTVLSLSSCYRDVESIKNNAPKFLKERGYTIISYDGYESNLMMGGNGGFVAYQVKDSKDFVYTLEICEWNGEYQIYNQKCLNAVSNK